MLHILLTVLAIGLLMVVHEGGHYLTARWAKMRVLKFSVGFGPVLFRKQPAGSSTVFQIALIPFIAYVQIAGMNPFEETDPNDEALFNKKGALARIVVIAGGPVANYLFASLLVFVLGLVGFPDRQPIEGRVVVTQVQAGSAAAAAGLHEGDRIVAVEGQPITETQAVIERTRPRAGRPTLYRIAREGRELDVVVTPRNVGGSGRIGAGIGPETRLVHRRMGLFEAAKFSLVAPARLSIMQLEAIGDAFARRSTENFGGVVEMGRASVQAAREGAANFVFFVAAISVSLGFFNLLPFPALDGGRLVFLLIELVFRRRVNEKVEATVNMIGMATLLTLMVLITYRDILRISGH